jgi:PAS domain S-box-containing protein/putative nucleotidyltransferase with HDIG domain
MTDYKKRSKAVLIEQLKALEETLCQDKKQGEAQRLLHELQVHQIELEMQNRELKEAQAALEESRDRYVGLYDFAPVGYASFDANGVTLEANLTFAAMLGSERGRLIGKPFARCVSDTHSFFAHLRQCREDGAKTTAELVLKFMDGAKITAQLISEAVRDSDDNVVIRSSITDITRRKQVEKALQEEQKQSRQIIETARDAFVSIDAEGIITDWNPCAADVFGWSREEALGRLVTETIIPPEFREVHKKGIEHYLATGEGPILNQHLEITALHRDGHTIPVELSIVPLRMDGSVRFNAFIRNISGHVRAREALEKSRRQLRASLIGTVVAVSRAVGARDPYTAGHQQRVSQLSRAIAQEMGLDKEQIDGLRLGASIHDIGKIYLPAEILSKPMKLTDLEYELIKSHAQVGYDILKDIEFPWPVAEIAHQHHERLDGSGYPQGLKGDEICLEARIVSVADGVEAISSFAPTDLPWALTQHWKK